MQARLPKDSLLSNLGEQISVGKTLFSQNCPLCRAIMLTSNVLLKTQGPSKPNSKSIMFIRGFA